MVDVPLALVGIAGVVTASVLTLLVLPTLYDLLERRAGRGLEQDRAEKPSHEPAPPPLELAGAIRPTILPTSP